MGNSAVITTEEELKNGFGGIGVYLHWNGGRDSVEAFLEYCRLKGYRPPEVDCYGWARLCQVIGNFFGGSDSIGIDKLVRLDCDNYDNGVYIIKDWGIVARRYMHNDEQQMYPLNEMLLDIDGCQPEQEQLGRKFLEAELIPVEEIKVGDSVYMPDFRGDYELCKVLGIGDGRIVDGFDTKGVPYVERFEGGNNADNVNCYLKGEDYRVLR